MVKHSGRSAADAASGHSAEPAPISVVASRGASVPNAVEREMHKRNIALNRARLRESRGSIEYMRVAQAEIEASERALRTLDEDDHAIWQRQISEIDKRIADDGGLA